MYSIEVHTHPRGNSQFERWFGGLDTQTALKVNTHLTRLASGNFTNTKSLGKGLFEVRIRWGSGYRVYFTIERNELILLLVGGDKSSQSRDIRKARKMLAQRR